MANKIDDPARWEYKVIPIAEVTSEIQLNNYGSSGWELIAIGGRFGETAYLKRLRRAQS